MEKAFFFKSGNKDMRIDEGRQIIDAITEIRENMCLVYDRLNYTSDELITDSLNYELLALKTKHRYFTEKAREMKLTFVLIQNRKQ